MGNHLLIVAVLFFALIILKIPIYIALLASSIYLQYFVNDMSVSNIIVGMYESIARPSLMAIPFYVLAGSVMANTSLGKRLMDLFSVIFRPFKSGMAVACLAANAFFGAISGSTPAATATFSRIAHTPLSKRYDEDLATGLITSSGALSGIIPPSIGMILFAIAAEISVGKLFLTGFVPGLLIVAIVAAYLAFKCRKMPRQPFPRIREILGAIKRGLPVIVLPVIVLGGIYSGFFTPTEAGAISAAYAIIIGVFGLRDIKGKQLLKTLMDSAVISAQIFIIVAAGTTFSQALTIAQVGSFITEAFRNVSSTVFLLYLNIGLLIAGCFVDGGSAILIFAPLALPVATVLGIDPFHLGIVFVINVAIGSFTPPFGLNIFVSQSVLGKSMGNISKTITPFLICYLLALIIITYMPQISLFILRWGAGY